MRFIIFFGLIVLLTQGSFAQLSDTAWAPGIGENRIEHLSDNYKIFVDKIKDFKVGRTDKVRIIQIGDSHLQGGVSAAVVRKGLQEKYGNGGRGIVFPYSLANTNGPKDYLAQSTVKWESSWITHKKEKFMIGLPGISVKSDTINGKFSVLWKTDSTYYPYNKGFLMYSMDRDKNGIATVNRSFEKRYNNEAFDTVGFYSNSMQDSVVVEFTNSSMTIHNLYCENNQKGVVYSSVGVAGAYYRDYYNNDLFAKQLKYYDLDLLIVALGTNESNHLDYTEKQFEDDVEAMFKMLQKQLPRTAVLIVAPGENYFIKDKAIENNKRVLFVNRILREQCAEFGFALWDLYKVMGGEGGMLRWKEAGLVNKDHLHYLSKGYKLQGKLLLEAIENTLH